MSRYNYSDFEQELNAVLRHQADELAKLEGQASNELEIRIEESETLLKRLGYGRQLEVLEPQAALTKAVGPKKIIVVPSWEYLCLEAERAVGAGHCLESIFTEDELRSNEEAIKMLQTEYDDLHRLDNLDLTISVTAGLLGALVDILWVGIPKKTPEGISGGTLANFVRDRFEQRYPEVEMHQLSLNKGSKVPYDAQDNRHTQERIEGLSAYYHRLLSLGHDPLLGFVVGVKDIMAGSMTTIDKKGKIISQTMGVYGDRKEASLFAALGKQIAHLKSDITTSMGLPAPMMPLFNLFQFGGIGEYDLSVAEITQGMYFEGYDFIHFAAQSLPVMLVEVFVRLSYALKRMKEGFELKDSIPYSLDREKKPKLATMLFLGHSAATAINAGKVYFKKDPLDINYPQWLAFGKYSYQQLKWNLLEKPMAKDVYVRGLIHEELEVVLASINSGFEDLSKDYIVVMN